VFFFELNVGADALHRGLGRALIDLAERSSTSRGRGGTTVELNVHKENTDAQGFYKHLGFAVMGKASGGLALVMSRKR